MLLTRFRTRRLRFAIITVSHTLTNRATILTQAGNGENRTFLVFNRHCVGVVVVPVFSMIIFTPLRKVSLTIIILSVAWGESRRPESARYNFRKMDFREVAECHRPKDA